MKGIRVLIILFFFFSKLIAQVNTDPYIGNVDPCYGPDCLQYWIDNDGDGYGVLPVYMVSPNNIPNNFVPYNIQEKDCNDTDPNITITTYYKDDDGDGQGDPYYYDTNFCSNPPDNSWVLNDLDCNDYDATINSNTVWYVDSDGDGFGGTIIVAQQCDQPSLSSVPNDKDCNDNDATVGEAKHWYVDSDGDGYGDPSSPSILSCLSSIPNYVLNNLDLCPQVNGSFSGCVVPTSGNQFSNENYVFTITPKTQVNNLNQIDSADNVLINVTYFDGLGRPIQKINHKQSTSGNNIVTHFEYDSAGRQIREYLPYKSTLNNLFFESNAQNETIDYYAPSNIANTGDPNFEPTAFPYAQNEYETGIIDRIYKKSMPGYDWRMGSGHELKFDYATNISNEVRNFKVVYDSDFVHHLEPNGFYQANQLSKSIIKDENWTSLDALNKTTQEFKDRNGNVILVRKFESGNAYNTYYVYDDVGNLSYVIPPTASDAIDVTYNSYAVSNRNYPWTTLALVDGNLAEEYNRLFSEYKNELILDADLFNKYGGQGGFTISANSNNEPILSINISTIEPMELKIGEIVSLKEIGEFKDSELGRISGVGYEYIFSVSKNSLFVSGKGLVSSLNITFNGNTKLVYNKNYSWAELVDIDPNDANRYQSVYNSMPNETILTANVPNQYGASGGINITIDDNDDIFINLNISTTTPLSLKKGIAIPLEIERRITDRDLDVIESNGYHYQLSINENSLFIVGSGSFSTISRASGSNQLVTMAIPQDIIEGLCYQYRYDNRNRLIEKKIPGKGWEYLVYDKLDRLALSQDANMRIQNKWLFTKYDTFSRIVYNGEFLYNSPTGNINSALRLELQGLVNSNAVLNETRSTTPFQNGTININYTNTIFPNATASSFTIFNVNYYDDYSFQPYSSPITVPSTSYNSTTLNDILTNVKSLPTGSLTKVLGTNQWILNSVAYDQKGRQVWSKSQNSYLQTEDTSEMQLDFTGKILESKTTHNKTGVTSNLIVVNKFEYDHADRLLKQTQKIGNQPEELIVFNKYDELGKLIQKKVGDVAPISGIPFSSVVGLQTIDYSYNIRGWLKTINNPVSLSNDLFAFKINYNDPQVGAIPLYNGNISETSWITSNDNKLRNYKYTYDHLNRLTNADYVGNYTLFNNATQTENYTEGNIQYDKNGNITHLERYGLKNSNNTIVMIDNLIYNPFNRSNKLKQVIDTSSETEGFKDDTNVGDDYTYDINGNMTSDTNKRIVNITYNHLNLPTRIDFLMTSQNDSNDNYIEYIYDAAGAKLRKIVKPENVPNTTTDYAGGYIYENNTLQFFSQPEGYVANNSGTFSYVYQYKDHLGNVRLSYKKNGANTEIVEENNYYPFGLKQLGYNFVYNPVGNDVAEKYKYNGKEFQDELGLNLYDYGARNYDPALGRWMNIDPMAEKSRRWTPYRYAFNNPLRYTDPDGMYERDDIITFMNDGSVKREETEDDFDIIRNEKGDKEIRIEHDENGSQIGELQKINDIQFMLIEDNAIAREVFEFAASTTANTTSNSEFGLDVFQFNDGFSMNLIATGEISARGFPNVTPMGQYGEIDLGSNHYVRDATWVENNHSHPGISLTFPSGFSRRYNNGPIFEPVGVAFGDRAFMTKGKMPINAYLYSSIEDAYIKYDGQSATKTGNRR